MHFWLAVALLKEANGIYFLLSAQNGFRVMNDLDFSSSDINLV
jgi:hypothetical protein